ncbi:MAG: hypothetical protein MJ123_04155 [Lachnospiraceae bacterium]|nr:hypothetical protein [Lachnospiraceae bacterium]
MENIDRLTVGGYIFASEEDADAAENEIKKIAYIESHTDLTNVSVIKKVYEKALETRAFTTPIGLEYMHNLWTILKDSGIPEDELKPIPLYSTFHRMVFNNDAPAKRRMTRAEKKEQTLRVKYRNAVLVAFIFGILSFAMLAITLNGTTPNILNYKNAITNQYSAWEQDLTERERVIREKERELEINP